MPKKKKYQDLFLGDREGMEEIENSETERYRVEERDGKGERDLEEKIHIDLRRRKNKRKLECQRMMK